MDNVIQALYKDKDQIKFGWNKETGAVSYNVYVGIYESSLSLLESGIKDVSSEKSESRGKVVYYAQIADVRSTLSLGSTSDFSNSVLYFTITYVDSAGSESSLNDSIIVEVPPVGIISKPMKDDPTIRRHPFVFSENEQRWVKQIGSDSGAQIADLSDYYKMNITTDLAYDGTNISTMLSYLSDASSGAPAKLTTYSYSGGLVSKIAITDSTVP